MRYESGLQESDIQRVNELFSEENIGNALLQSATSLNIANPEDPYPTEAVFETILPSGRTVVIKAVIPEKQRGPIDEFEALLLLRKLGIDAPRPVARVFTKKNEGFIVMDKLQGSSGRVIKDTFKDMHLSDENKRAILNDALERMQQIAETVRRDTGFYKPWRLKDFIVEYEDLSEGSKRIKTMRPIDFERAKVFDPQNPHDVRLGQGLDQTL